MIRVTIDINGKDIYSVWAQRVNEVYPTTRKRPVNDDRFKLRTYKLSDGRTMRHWASEGAHVMASRMIAGGLEKLLFEMVENDEVGWVHDDTARAARALGRRWSKAKNRFI